MHYKASVYMLVIYLGGDGDAVRDERKTEMKCQCGDLQRMFFAKITTS